MDDVRLINAPSIQGTPAPADIAQGPLHPFPTRELGPVVVALFVMGVLVSIAPSPPNDLWWHLRAGQLIAETGAVPQAQIFSWVLPPDTPFVYGAWLGELLLYWLYQAGGSELLHFTRNLLALIMLSIIAADARRRTGSWQFVGIGVLLAGVLTLNNISVRPQMWVWVPFALFLLILGRYADGLLRPHWLGLLPLLIMFWVNVHGTFVLGLGLLACYTGTEIARQILRSERAWTHAGWLGAATAATALATMANPKGPAIFAYVADLAANQAVRSLTTEWQPPTPSGALNLVFFASILGLITVFGVMPPLPLGEGRGEGPFRRDQPRAIDVLLVCGFLWLALSANRNIFWYGMVAMPVLADGLARLRQRATPQPVDGLRRTWPFRPVGEGLVPSRPGPAQNSRAAGDEPPPYRNDRTPSPLAGEGWGERVAPARRRSTWSGRALVMAPVLAVLALLQPWLVQSLPLPPPFGNRMLPPPAPALLSNETPIAAADYLRAHPAGSLYAELGYSSYLIWAVPNQRPFLDPRFELFSVDLWRDYINISNGRRAPELLDQYGADRVLLSRARQPQLSAALAASPSWEKEYEDAYAQVWRRA